ncbi:hypothetical protein LZ32DRAFT_658545 [Colletotrichum eremochloae]|nr:hypothetical protein LZ32DRAFT_658545 [Colletotrichum eremochloae]
MVQPPAKERVASEGSNNYSKLFDVLVETIETDDLLRQCTDIVGQIEATKTSAFDKERFEHTSHRLSQRINNLRQTIKLLRLKNSLSREDKHFLRVNHDLLPKLNNEIRGLCDSLRQKLTNIRNEGLAQSHSQPSSVTGVAQAPQTSELLSGDQSHLLEEILQAVQLANDHSSQNNDLWRHNNDLLNQNNNLLRQIEMNTRKKKGLAEGD